ncbi:hypothetical protein TWF730_009249 [Orbilia blumenaviensis]|uniref:Uncharacterized protein n=1 Tax=Orbilia blumenaviensis TaxID=1796055 RepID=A0AAV9V128_9PEZI
MPAEKPSNINADTAKTSTVFPPRTAHASHSNISGLKARVVGWAARQETEIVCGAPRSIYANTPLVLHRLEEGSLLRSPYMGLILQATGDEYSERLAGHIETIIAICQNDCRCDLNYELTLGPSGGGRRCDSQSFFELCKYWAQCYCAATYKDSRPTPTDVALADKVNELGRIRGGVGGNLENRPRKPNGNDENLPGSFYASPEQRPSGFQLAPGLEEPYYLEGPSRPGNAGAFDFFRFTGGIHHKVSSGGLFKRDSLGGEGPLRGDVGADSAGSDTGDQQDI